MDDEWSTLWHVQTKIEAAEHKFRPAAPCDRGSSVGCLEFLCERLPYPGLTYLLAKAQACVEGGVPSCLVIFQNHGQTRRVREALCGDATKSNTLSSVRRIRQAHRTLGSLECVCQGVRVTPPRPTLQYQLVHPPLPVVGAALSLHREAQSNCCLTERQHEFFALRRTQLQLRRPEQLFQVAKHAVIISRGIVLTGDFAGEQGEREGRLVLEQAAKGCEGILEVLEALDRR